MKKYTGTRSGGTILWKSCLWICILAALSPLSVSWGEEIFTFAGSEIDGHGLGFSYLGVDLTQKVNNLLSLSGRIMPNYLTYKYYSGNSLIKADSPGVFTVAGIKLLKDNTTIGIFGGAEFRNTDLTPDDQDASVRGSTSAMLIQGEFDTTLPTRTNINLFASFSGTSNYSYEKGRIKQQITNLDYRKPFTFSIGMEQFLGRNADFRAEGVGLTLEVYHIPQKVSIAVHGGIKHDSTFGNGEYWGLQLYKGW